MKTLFKTILFGLLLLKLPAIAQTDAVISTFPLNEVKLRDGIFKNAEQVDLKYILDLDMDKLLAPYLKEAGLTKKADSYGNWENSGLDGHIGGHYISALSLMYASTQNAVIKQRLDYYLAELKRCQEANGDGYIGGVPGGKAMWKDIANGKIDAATFSLNKKWVPLYNIHKVFAGLYDAWFYTGNQTAKEMYLKLCDWAVDTFGSLSNEQIQQMLKSEHGGLNESFADAYKLTGDKKYLDLAIKFSHRAILDPLLRQEDKLTGLHANTQIPKVIGFEKISEIDAKEDWHKAATFFWDNVVYKRTVAIGGNSVREHFHPINNFTPMIEDIEGPETCNTYNMIKLSKQLYNQSGDTRYIDYIEKALYNHILSSQHPEKGGFVYFTSMRPNHYRVYSQPETSMWCCVGSGLENHAKYGEFIYAHNQKDIFVNLFIPSELDWKDQKIKLVQNTNFPETNSSELNFTEVKNGNFAVHIRVPHWANGNEISLKINGKSYPYITQNNYIRLNKKWKKGDKISVSIPIHNHLEQMPDGSPYVSIFYGPILLAAKTDTTDLKGLYADESRGGHIAKGRQLPLSTAPQLVVQKQSDIIDNLTAATKPLVFKSPDMIYEKDLELIPFYKVHDSRYATYFKFLTKDAYAKEQDQIKQQEARELVEKEKTVDIVYPGQQQPENDHDFKGEKTETGVHNDRHWRHSADWFSYKLKNKNLRGKKIVITCFGMDAGRSFDIVANGQKIGAIYLKGDKGNNFFDLEFNIPKEINKEVVEVLFKAHKNSIAGGIYEVKLSE